MASYSEVQNHGNHYGMSEAQETFLKQILLAVRDAREFGKKVNTEDIIDKILDKMSE